MASIAFESSRYLIDEISYMINIGIYHDFVNREI